MEHFEKSIIPVIESVYPSFTPLERTVADFFIHNTDESDLSARRTAWHGRSHQTGAEYVSGAAE